VNPVTPTPKSTRSKSQAPEQIVYVQASCQQRGLVECPNKQCKKNVGDCESDIGIDTEKPIKELRVPVTEREVKGGLFIGLENPSQDKYLGDIFFPAGTLKSGWTVFISNSNKKPQSKDKKKCGKKKKEDNTEKVVSSNFDITVRDKQGKEVNMKDIKPPLQLSAFAEISNNVSVSHHPCNDRQLTNRQDKGCFGYANKGDSDFTCMSEYHASKVGKNSKFSRVQTTTDHLTSFAVLLLPSSDSSGCDHSKLWWILTTCFLGGALLCCLLVIVASFHRRFRSIIYGYSDSQDIDSLTERVSKKMRDV